MKPLKLPKTIVWYYIAFGWSFFDLLQKLTTYRSEDVGLSILLTLLILSAVANINRCTYLYWPGLLILGIAFNEYTYEPERKNLSFAHPNILID